MTHDPKVIETIIALANEYQDNRGVHSTFPFWLANYKVPKVKWVPMELEDVWAISSEGEVFEMHYDRGMERIAGVYPTKEAAEAAASKIREFVKSLNESV